MNNQSNDIVLRYFDDVAEGATGEFTKQVTEEDVIAFAGITGDTNPVHLDKAYAATSIFGQRISHGMLVAGFISAVFGRVFPGPGWIYVNQSLKFKAPVFLGDTVTAQVTVTKLIDGKNMIEFDTVCKVGEKIVLDGTATLMSPQKPA
ncbi:MAG: MaoC family dehydratase [Rhodospirillales bacterium]|jgi:3-hydroxybutyryl-CoA dehydratase|nr:MaoC family dehydratase [Rhodospirillales bacterium]MDP6644906.1 MaoC family dehydratase [Rhodospirillales bacterium]|tara:strand:- start:1710 stop:2153 length:444 start_codon:yes stop_codon:yes gene_type:complete